MIVIMDKEHKMIFSSGLKGGFVGALLVIIIIVAVLVWFKPFNYRAVVIIEQTQLASDSRPVITIPEAELMSSLRDKGYLMTPAEYTNNMIGYYNTLIAFLSVFFVVFTVAGYFAIRGLSKKEVREEARELLKDSQSFRSEVLETIKGQFDADYVLTDVYEDKVKELDERVATLETNQAEPRVASRVRRQKSIVAKKEE